MAFNKDELIIRIEELSEILMSQTITILTFKEYNAEKHSIANILKRISLLYLLKQHRKILSESFMFEYLLYKPFKKQNLHKDINLMILEKIYTKYINHIVSGAVYLTDEQTDSFIYASN